MSATFAQRPLSDLLNLIEADIGKRNYDGAKGLASMFSNLAEHLRDKGISFVSDVSTLPYISGANTGAVLVLNNALYVFSASAATPDPLDYPANGGGFWKFVMQVGKREYSQAIGNSTAGTTSFTINHRLKTLRPSILCWEPATPGGATGYTLRDITALATVRSVDEDNTLVDFGLTIPATNQYTLDFKKNNS